MRCWTLALALALALSPSAFPQDWPTVPSPRPQVGDWVLLEIRGVDRRSGDKTKVDQLWTVEEVSQDAVLFRVRAWGETLWQALPWREGTLPAEWVTSFASTIAHPQGFSGRPAKLERPPTPPLERTETDEEATTVNTLSVTGRRVTLQSKLTYVNARFGLDGRVTVELDPKLPLLGIKRIERQIEPFGQWPKGWAGMQQSHTARVTKHGRKGDTPPKLPGDPEPQQKGEKRQEQEQEQEQEQ